VFDHDGLMPLNLARDKVVGQIPFGDELLKDVLDDVIVTAVLDCPDCCDVRWMLGNHLANQFHTVSYYEDWIYSAWAATSSGIMPAVGAIFQDRSNLLSIRLTADLSSTSKSERKINLPDGIVLVTRNVPSMGGDGFKNKRIFRFLAGVDPFNADGYSSGSFVLFPKLKIDLLKRLNPGRVLRRSLERLVEQKAFPDWSSRGETSTEVLAQIKEFLDLNQGYFANNHAYIEVVRLEEDVRLEIISSIQGRWEELVGGTLPFDSKARKKVLENVARHLPARFELISEEIRVRNAKKK
jgi:hypothetical protein